MESTPLVRAALALLDELSPYQGDRCLHVEAVARRSAEISTVVEDATARDGLVAAAWLHDIGYAPGLRVTGHHAIDGARYLQEAGWIDVVTSLVAHHSGAHHEAAQRGLDAELAAFAVPPAALSDLLTFADMTCGPAGEPMSVNERLEDIVARYPGEHPVRRAVALSAPQLRAGVARMERQLGLTGSQPM